MATIYSTFLGEADLVVPPGLDTGTVVVYPTAGKVTVIRQIVGLLPAQLNWNAADMRLEWAYSYLAIYDPVGLALQLVTSPPWTLGPPGAALLWEGRVVMPPGGTLLMQVQNGGNPDGTELEASAMAMGYLLNEP